MKNVVQTVADDPSSYVGASVLLEIKCRHILWSPCVAYFINNILKDIVNLYIHKATIEKKRRITIFIYHQSLVLSLMRSLTNRRQLTRFYVTRFAIN